jgi:hypothetical protein
MEVAVGKIKRSGDLERHLELQQRRLAKSE